MTQVGLVVNRALYADGRETDVELTGSFPVCNHFTLQPAVHCINTNGNYTAAAQLRAILETEPGHKGRLPRPALVY